jgi:GTP-binding protein HflX
LSRALIITLPDKYVIEEAKELANAAGYEPVAVLTQKYLERAKYGVGKGKAEEAARLVAEHSIDMIVFDSSIDTSAVYNLTKLCKVEVKDREKIILEIFAKRVSTGEAKLQVQLAELAYELPRARNKVRMAKQGEQPGFFGLGKYEVDVYTRMMKKRMAVLRQKVDEIGKRRNVLRGGRQHSAFASVALAGYTASGKTTLFNKLTGETKQADSGVFTTLAPTTRALAVGGRNVLLTDTVGFISNLPTYLVEAFKSTLEEISLADVVLLLIDVSQPEEKFSRSYRSSLSTLSDLGVTPSRVLVVLNKRDLTGPEEIEMRKRSYNLDEAIPASAKTGEGMDELMKAIGSRLSRHVEEGNPA